MADYINVGRAHRPRPRPKWAGQGRAGGGLKRPINSHDVITER